MPGWPAIENIVFKKVGLWFDIPAQQPQRHPPPPDFASLPARGKADALWELITENETGGSFMNPIETLAYAGQPRYLDKMQDTHADWRESTHKKITHGKGAQARSCLLGALSRAPMWALKDPLKRYEEYINQLVEIDVRCEKRGP